MLKNILFRFLIGLLTVLFAVVAGAIFGLGAFFPLKAVVVVAFIVGFCFPSIISGE